jgi:hypothetical protein
MTPDPTGYVIRPGSPEGKDLGLTLDRVCPGSYFWRNGNLLWFSAVEVRGMHPRKVLHDLVVRANVRGYVAVIPAPSELIDQELLEWGFTLRTLDCKDGRKVPVYLRGPTGLPVVDATFEQFGVKVAVTDEGVATGFVVRVETYGGVAATLTASRGGIAFRCSPGEGRA